MATGRGPCRSPTRGRPVEALALKVCTRRERPGLETRPTLVKVGLQSRSRGERRGSDANGSAILGPAGRLLWRAPPPAPTPCGSSSAHTTLTSSCCSGSKPGAAELYFGLTRLCSRLFAKLRSSARETRPAHYIQLAGSQRLLSLPPDRHSRSGARPRNSGCSAGSRDR
jgi:hypothetical protein